MLISNIFRIWKKKKADFNIDEIETNKTIEVKPSPTVNHKDLLKEKLENWYLSWFLF